MIEEGRHGRGKDGVVTMRDFGLLPTGGDDLGGWASFTRRARMVGEGSIAVHDRAGSWIAMPSWPPPAPTSSRRPTSGTACRINGASAAT